MDFLLSQVGTFIHQVNSFGRRKLEVTNSNVSKAKLSCKMNLCKWRHQVTHLTDDCCRLFRTETRVSPSFKIILVSVSID